MIAEQFSRTIKSMKGTLNACYLTHPEPKDLQVNEVLDGGRSCR